MPNQFWKYARSVCFAVGLLFGALHHGREAQHTQQMMAQLHQDVSSPAALHIEKNGNIHHGFLASLAASVQ